jgi:hypothetical protein
MSRYIPDTIRQLVAQRADHWVAKRVKSPYPFVILKDICLFCAKIASMTVVEAFDDVADILARMDPAKIMELRPSKPMAERVEELVYKKKDGEITSEESVELERYLALDLLINLAKARARRLLAA